MYFSSSRIRPVQGAELAEKTFRDRCHTESVPLRRFRQGWPSARRCQSRNVTANNQCPLWEAQKNEAINPVVGSGSGRRGVARHVAPPPRVLRPRSRWPQCTSPRRKQLMPRKFLACMVTDTGGIDDRSFNASSWQGVKEAESANDHRQVPAVLERERLRPQHQRVHR